MTLANKIDAEVQGLAPLGLEALRGEWRKCFGAPPRLRSPELLRHMLAWRIQTAALGDLPQPVRRQLRSGRGSAAPAIRLTVGTRLAREWQGVRHDVDVVEGGFRHDGVTYASLSKVATVITGVKWNGYRFFGLKEKTG